MSDSGEAAPDEDSADTLVLTFDPPIKVRAASYIEMTLREPTTKMVRQAEGKLRGGVNVESLRLYQIALITSVSGWPVEAVEEMTITQNDRAGRFLQRFTSLGRVIGLT